VGAGELGLGGQPLAAAELALQERGPELTAGAVGALLAHRLALCGSHALDPHLVRPWCAKGLGAVKQ